MTSILDKSALGSVRRSLWALGFGAVLVAALPGCLAHASGEVVAEYPAEYVEPPPRVEYYPSVHYRGAPAYLVEGRWYYRTRNRWIVFRDEPTELRDYRVRQAPAYLAPHRDHYARQRDHVRAERRADERRHVERLRLEAAQQRRADERRHEQQRAEERRREEEHRRAEQFRRAEQHRQHERQRQAEERRQHYEQQRAAQQRAADERREHDRRGRHARKRDRDDEQDRGREHGERDRRQFRHD